MTVYEILKGLALLPACVIVLLVAGLVVSLRWRRAGTAVLWATVAFFYLLSAPYIANRFTHWVERIPPLLDLGQVRGAQAMVVLSAGATAAGAEYGGVALDKATVLRMRYAAHLYRLTGLPVLVSGGPILGQSATLAGAMKTALEQDFAVPVTWVEAQSTNTGENAQFSAAILQPANIHKIVLVTDAAHMPRAVDVFRDAGFEVVPAPTGFVALTHDLPRDLIPRMSAFESAYAALYEYMGGVWYRIRPEPTYDADRIKPVPPEAGP